MFVSNSIRYKTSENRSQPSPGLTMNLGLLDTFYVTWHLLPL